MYTYARVLILCVYAYIYTYTCTTQTKVQYIYAKTQYYPISQHTKCVVCGKHIGTKIIAVHPPHIPKHRQYTYLRTDKHQERGVLVHYSCSEKYAAYTKKKRDDERNMKKQSLRTVPHYS